MSTDPVNLPPGSAAILRELDHLRSDIRDHRAETNDRFEGVEKKMAAGFEATLTEQRKTNGRVRAHDRFIAAAKGIVAAVALVTPFLVLYLNKAL